MEGSAKEQPPNRGKEPSKELDEILKDAGQEALRSAHGTGDLEKLSKGADAAKALAEAREVNLGLGWLPRWAKLLASWATALTLVVAFVTLYLQREQFLKSEERQRASEEDAQWREAMKAVSFEDPSKALAGAMWMESFFDSRSPRYRELSRRVAASLLSKAENTAGFDVVLTDLVNHTNPDNQNDVIDIAQKVNDLQWERYGQAPEDPTKLRAATMVVLNGLEGPRVVGGHEVDSKAFSAGTWEIATASHALWQIWVGKSKASPRGKDLGDIVLEKSKKGEFFSADFTDATLTNCVFSHVSFQGANLTGAKLVEVRILASVDLSGVTQFDGSQWIDTDWWHAEKVSLELCRYLEVNSPKPKGTGLPSGCQ